MDTNCSCEMLCSGVVDRCPLGDAHSTMKSRGVVQSSHKSVEIFLRCSHSYSINSTNNLQHYLEDNDIQHVGHRKEELVAMCKLEAESSLDVVPDGLYEDIA